MNNYLSSRDRNFKWSTIIDMYKHEGNINVIKYAVNLTFVHNKPISESEAKFCLDRLENGEENSLFSGVNAAVLYEFIYGELPTNYNKLCDYVVFLKIPKYFLQNCRLLVGFDCLLEFEIPQWFDDRYFYWNVKIHEKICTVYVPVEYVHPVKITKSLYKLTLKRNILSDWLNQVNKEIKINRKTKQNDRSIKQE